VSLRAIDSELVEEERRGNLHDEFETMIEIATSPMAPRNDKINWQVTSCPPYSSRPLKMWTPETSLKTIPLQNGIQVFPRRSQLQVKSTTFLTTGSRIEYGMVKQREY
jgi:hypothetical protein